MGQVGGTAIIITSQEFVCTSAAHWSCVCVICVFGLISDSFRVNINKLSACGTADVVPFYVDACIVQNQHSCRLALFLFTQMLNFSVSSCAVAHCYTQSSVYVWVFPASRHLCECSDQAPPKPQCDVCFNLLTQRGTQQYL